MNEPLPPFGTDWWFEPRSEAIADHFRNYSRPRQTHGHPLYRFFKPVFEPVLSANHSAERESGSYLAMAANEGALRSVFTEPIVNGGAFLVGAKGIGKTTLL